MRHILIITTGLTGILHSSFELAARLEGAGYKVTLANPVDVAKKVTTQGFQYVQLPAINFDPAPKIANEISRISKIWVKLTQSNLRRKLAVEALGMDAFIDILEDIAPELVLIDVELHDHIITLYSKKIPMVLLSQWFTLRKSPGLPPLISDIIPGEGWRGTRWGMEWAWARIKTRRWWIKQKKWILSVGTDRRSILKHYAKSVDFPLKYIKDNYWPGPFNYNTLPILSMTLKELEFSHPVKPNLHYIGPMVYPKRKESSPEVDAKFKLIFQQKKARQAKLIYCSVSTFKKGDQVFLKKVVQAVDGEKDWILVLSLGGLLNKDFLQPLPDNVFAYNWVPQLMVLEQADCSINHGGIHTINECIYFGVPMLIYSGKKSDQDGCAARVAFHKLGIKADKDDDGPKMIKRRIIELLSTPTYKMQVERCQKASANYKSDKALESYIENYSRYKPDPFIA